MKIANKIYLIAGLLFVAAAIYNYINADTSTASFHALFGIIFITLGAKGTSKFNWHQKDDES
ncbi:hypothetical protein IU402_06770 [Aerococcaceae bacterium zg-BR9]|uniref:hypothetical protein n=1 Tax=Aerococcaceae bacterium zg-1292 TaxID=2774330 RepID=UPI004062DAD8|nr:hypothetical protein [Aerococcaceae bacterium zg-BR9]MBF6626277.1 hypothetical protein [Aerococcaceae bacterium zg-BR9]